MRHPKDIGDQSTLAIMHALRLCGLSILVPFGENTRYDLVTDDGSALRRVQCKTGWYSDGVVKFATCSSYAHQPNPKVIRRAYHGEIEDFAVFCPPLGTVYLIPIEDLEPKTQGCLRVDPARNGQRRRIRLAAAYEIARFEIF
jgi:hypothetical protein